MSVTTVFRRFHEDAWERWVDDPEHFDERNHPDCESIQLGGELLAVGDLVARARNRQVRALHKDFLFNVAVGAFGTSVYDNDGHPLAINAGDVARASRLMDEISPADLREVYDLGRLKRTTLKLRSTGCGTPSAQTSSTTT